MPDNTYGLIYAANIHNNRRGTVMNTRHRFARWLLPALLLPCALIAQNPVLVQDINAGSGSAFFAADNYLVSREVINDVLYIQAYTPGYGTELWKSAPPYTGAALMKDLNAGTAKGSSGKYIAAFGKLFFNGANAVGSALCWSDGTAQGTAALTNGKAGYFAFPLVESQGRVFSHQEICEVSVRGNVRLSSYLYATDPVTGACTLLKTISHQIPWKAQVNGTMLFQVCTWLQLKVGTDLAFSLWKSNGTAKGTVKVTDLPMPLRGDQFRPTASTPLYEGLLTRYVADGTTVYFACGDAAHGGAELWKSNGTAAGTMAVTDINPGSGNSFPTMAARMGDYLYFCADDGTNGYQIWRYPLAGGSAQRVTDIDGGAQGADPMWLTPLNGKLIFSAYDPENGRELWVSNGLPYNDPANVTAIVGGGIAPGSASSDPNYFTAPTSGLVDDDEKHKYQMEGLGSYVYFPANDGTGFALWRSDGATTEKLGARNPRYLTAINGILMFIAQDDLNGRELWKFDPAYPPSPKSGAVLPEGLALAQNYPNPFNATTVVEYSLAAEGRVVLRVQDMLGREVAVLADGTRGAGRHAVSWNAAGLPSGVYTCCMEAEGTVLTRRMAVLK